MAPPANVIPNATLRKMLCSDMHTMLARDIRTAASTAFTFYEASADGVVVLIEDADRRRALLTEHLREVFATGEGLKPRVMLTQRKFKPVFAWRGTSSWRALFFYSDRATPISSWSAGVITGSRKELQLCVVIARRLPTAYGFVEALAVEIDIPDLCWWCESPTDGTVRCRLCAQATYCGQACRLSDRDEHRAGECGRFFCCSDCRRVQRASETIISVDLA